MGRQSRSMLLLSISKPRTRDYVILVCIGEQKLRTAHLHETSQWDEKVWDPRRDAETFLAETETRSETHRSETETRPRHWALCTRRDRNETLVRLETVSRPRRRDRDQIPGFLMLLVKHLLLTLPPWASKHCRWSEITSHSKRSQDW